MHIRIVYVIVKHSDSLAFTYNQRFFMKTAYYTNIAEKIKETVLNTPYTFSRKSSVTSKNNT